MCPIEILEFYKDEQEKSIGGIRNEFCIVSVTDELDDQGAKTEECGRIASLICLEGYRLELVGGAHPTFFVFGRKLIADSLT